MTQVPVLAMPNYQKTFMLKTDTSQYGLGVVLMQDKHSIAYYSTTLGKRASNKPIYEKELTAIVFAVLKWKHYLLWRQLIEKTDQRSMKHFLEQRVANGNYQKWLINLMEFDIAIEYCPGRSN